LRIRAYQIGTIFAGVVSAVMLAFGHAMAAEGPEYLVWSAVAYTMLACSAVYPWLEVWRVADLPETPEAAQKNAIALLLCTLVHGALLFLDRIFSETAAGRMFSALRFLNVLFGIWGVASLVWHRKTYGGIVRLFDSCFGLLVVIFLLVGVLYTNTEAVMFNFLVLAIFILLWVFVVVLRPKCGWSRRRFCSKDEVDAHTVIEHDPAYLLLQVCLVSAIGHQAGFIISTLYAPVANSSYSGVVVIVVWQLFMVFFTNFTARITQCALTEADAIPFMVSPILIADAFGNMVFMTISIKTPSFWTLLALEFVLLVARDADLWGMSKSSIKDLMQYPAQLASICMFSELTFTVTLICVVMFEVALESAEIGIPQMTLKMTQSERWSVVTASSVILAMQLFALAVSHCINERKWKRAGDAQGTAHSEIKADVQKAVLKMWETHGLYLMLCTYGVMGLMVSSAIVVKSVMLEAS